MSARTAVVIVHGMGNQKPLETMRGLARALFAEDDALEIDDSNVATKEGKPERRMWTSLDRLTRDVDLPVVTTARVKVQAGGSPRNIDFHEFYWAHLSAEPRFVAVPLWLFDLVKKGPAKMPAGVRPLWYVIGSVLAFWILCAVYLALGAISTLLGLQPAISPVAEAVLFAGGLAAGLCWVLMGRRGLWLLPLGVLAWGLFGHLLWLTLKSMIWLVASLANHIITAPDLPRAVQNLPSLFTPQTWPTVAAAALIIFVALNSFFLLTVVGDAARYFRRTPGNIAMRREIRKLGVDRLVNLHAAQGFGGSPKYDRIVVIAHSLGTVIAYDVLRAYWSQVAKSLGDPHKLKCGKDQDAAKDIGKPAWRSRARNLVRELAAAKSPRWIVSDFITLGSPLSMAEFLLAEGRNARELEDSFKIKQTERELPKAPADILDKDGRLAFAFGNGRLFHHAALFSLTRWSNLYFPVKAIFWGDLVGGPVGDRNANALFGQGVRDVPLSLAGVPGGGFGAHVHYWSKPSAKAGSTSCYLRALREAVNLLDKEE